MDRPVTCTGKGKAKKKSRRQRRKPQNLLEEYNRRKRQNVWLETHIWHAKRMKMVNVWGYRLAEKPCDKSFKAAHRAASQNCLLQDISYHSCTEISGEQENIMAAMSHITSKEIGAPMASKQFVDKSREGCVMLYQPDKYPYQAIGPVSFMWRPKEHSPEPEPAVIGTHNTGTIIRPGCSDADNSTDGSNLNIDVENIGKELPSASLEPLSSTYLDQLAANCESNVEKKAALWIWIHPACFTEASQAITTACQLVGQTVIKKESSLPLPQENGCLETRNVDVYSSEDALVMSSLRFDLVRFRLTGPLSHALLVSTLELADTTRNGKEKKPPCKDTNVEKQSLLSTDATRVWNSIRDINSAAALPSGCMIGLTVVDPRLGLPDVKTSVDAAVKQLEQDRNGSDAVSTSLSMPAIPCWPTKTAGSPIWEANVRHHVKATKIPEHELNIMRSNLLLPGSRLDLREDTSHVPVLLVQQPGEQGTGYGSGWDIILPSGWAMAFWMALVYRGARVGGLREARNGALEREEPAYPHDYPDTTAGMEYHDITEKEGSEKYARYPPAKRPNYNKLGVQAPFSAPWKQLVTEWSTNGNPVVSCPETQVRGVPVVSSDQSESQSNLGQSGKEKELCSRESKISCGDLEASMSDAVEDENSVSFYVLRSKKKLNQLREVVEGRRQKRGRKPMNCHSAKVDVGRTIEDVLYNDLTSLVCVSLRMVNKGYPLPNATVAIPSESDYEALRKSRAFGGPVEPLHKGKKTTTDVKESNLIGSCTREIIGFVTSGHMALSHGSGLGIAYCALPGLVRLLSSGSLVGEVVVLVRNTVSKQYRLARLRVL